MAEIIGKGAEAVVYLEGNVLKDRIKKGYRLAQIDEKLRKSRTRREAKILMKLAEMDFPAPRLVSTDDFEKIAMSFVSGDKVRDVLEEGNCDKLCSEIGKRVAELHNAGIIHGDLTTSNIILEEERIVFIDFGLSFFSEKAEDKAVDLHLMKQALESKHYKIWEKCFSCVLEGYKKTALDYDVIIERFHKVESRGRNKAKG